MKIFKNAGLILIAIIIMIAFSTNGFADDVAKQQATDKKDKTGTNPVNFQRDLRIFNEYSWFNTEGDGSQNLTTLEFRTPFAGGKWQWRVGAHYNWIEAS